MSNVPGYSPLKLDLEEIRHSGDEAYDDVTAPEDPARDEPDEAADPETANVRRERRPLRDEP